jgi:thiol:disulfide interchange protein
VNLAHQFELAEIHINTKLITMKISLRVFLLLPSLFLGIAAAPFKSHAADATRPRLPDIYDESLGGQKQLAQALQRAKKEDKRVLLQFGANWCGWCHKLHTLFETDKAISGTLQNGYIVVMVDMNKGHNGDFAAKYQADKIGLPCIVILDSEGKHLTTKNTGELEEGDHHSPEKVLAFLNQWSPKKT